VPPYAPADPAVAPSRPVEEVGSVTETYISADMAAAVGRELGRRVSFPISASDIRKWAVAVYWPEEPPRLYWDEAYAATTSHAGIVAPEEFNPFAWMTAEPAGPRRATGEGEGMHFIERSLGIEPPPLRFVLNGGLSVEYGVRMRPGDVITAVSKLAGYREREGRLGRMLFAVTEESWTNQQGAPVKRAEMTLIRY